MDIFSNTKLTHHAVQLLDDLSELLDIPVSRYESAERSYKSVGKWLDRPESLFASHETTIYPQGSFRLGTVIKPLNDEEDYDLDVVCEVELTKERCTQANLKTWLGTELKAYAKVHGMSVPEEARRCWTLVYADGAQFHMDVLPALPDNMNQIYEIQSLDDRNRLAQTSIAITDNEHSKYLSYCNDWPASNPKGYCEWFRSKMQTIFEARRRAMMLMEAKATIEEIPEYRVKTPLQSAIKILKRHRDMRFAEDTDIAPISIILTTLSAHAYNQETTISAALFGILQRMEYFIEVRNGIYWIPNPTDPRENFADKWEKNPAKKDAFFDWLEMARTDFTNAARESDFGKVIDILSPRMGRQLVESAAKKRGHLSTESPSNRALLKRQDNRIRRILDAPHRKPVAWKEFTQGNVVIESLKVTRNGFRPYLIENDGPDIPKNCDLVFEANTNVQQPYKVYWQVVNTGHDAQQARGLRGGFEQGFTDSGKLTRKESTRYSGSHSIECFIVKDGYCVARSGPFLVNIQ